MVARPPSARPETGRPAFELEPARASRSRGRSANPICRPECPGAQSDPARRARSRCRARSQRDDGEGAISRVGDPVSCGSRSKSDKTAAQIGRYPPRGRSFTAASAWRKGLSVTVEKSGDLLQHGHQGSCRLDLKLQVRTLEEGDAEFV